MVQRTMLNEYILRLAEIREDFLEGMLTMSDKGFVRVRSFNDYQVTPQWTIHHLMQHEAEHWSQIMTIREAGERFLRSG